MTRVSSRDEDLGMIVRFPTTAKGGNRGPQELQHERSGAGSDSECAGAPPLSALFADRWDVGDDNPPAHDRPSPQPRRCLAPVPREARGKGGIGVSPGWSETGPPPSAEFALGGVGALRAEPGVRTQWRRFPSAEGLRAGRRPAHIKSPPPHQSGLHSRILVTLVFPPSLFLLHFLRRCVNPESGGPRPKARAAFCSLKSIS